MQDAVTCRDMEERSGCHERRWNVGLRWWRRHVTSSDCLCLGQTCCTCHCCNVQDVGNRTTMSELCTLREPSCSRGVENCCVIFWFNLCHGQRTSVSSSECILPTNRGGRNRPRVPSDHHVQRRSVLDLQQPLKTLTINNENFGLTVFQCVFHLRGCPPRIHSNKCRAQRHCCPIRHDPFRIVAHRDSNSIVSPYPVRREVMSQYTNLTMDLSIGVSLVLIDQVVLVGMNC